MILSSSSIILDKSGFTEIFGTKNFYKFIETNKTIPHSTLESKYLEYSYLNIEKFEIGSFSNLLRKSNKIEELSKYIRSLSESKYKDFIAWINDLAQVNNELKSLLPTIPLFRYKDNIYSVKDYITIDSIWIIFESTKPIIDVIIALGFEPVYFESKFQSILVELIKREQSYVNINHNLYKKITDKLPDHNLSATNKIKLFNYFNENIFMAGIDKSKYIDELELFNNNRGKSKPVSKLLSPMISSLSKYLKKFCMVKEEFRLLTESHKRKLIGESHLFERFLLDKDLFSDWSSLFNESNISDYTKDVDFWYIKASENSVIRRNQLASIPWFFIDNNIRFVSNSEIYCPKSLSNLNDEKYNTVLNIISSAIPYKIPHYSCKNIALNKDFHINNLGINDYCLCSMPLNLKDTNIFLDWLEKHKENEFLYNWNFTESKNNLFNIYDHSSAVYNGKKLIHNYLSKEEFKSKYIPINSKLFSLSRSKIGLLQEEILLEYIIDNNDVLNELVNYIPSDINKEIITKFLEAIDSLKLSSSSQYDKDSVEHKIISFLLQQNEKTQTRFRKKIYIDDTLINDSNILNQVNIDINGKIYCLKMSEILHRFGMDKSNELKITKIIDSFIDIKDFSNLKDKIFKATSLSFIDVYKKLELEDSKYLYPMQIFFIMLCNISLVSDNQEQLIYCKPFFDDHIQDIDTIKKFNKELLSLLYQFKITLSQLKEFNKKFSFLKLRNQNMENTKDNILDFSLTILDESISIPSEETPAWLKEWINQNDKEKESKKYYLKSLGFKDSQSDISLFRKSILNINNDIYNTIDKYNDVIKNKDQLPLLKNTIYFIQNKSSSVVTKNINIIKKILSNFEDNEYSKIPFPVQKIDSNNNKYYNLEYIKDSQTVYNHQDIEKDFRNQMENLLHIKNKTIIDQSIPKKFISKFNILPTSTHENINTSLIESNAVPFEECYYIHWDLKNEYSIYIIKELKGIPYLITFEEHIIKSVIKENEYSIYLNNKYYVLESHSNQLLDNLPNAFPKDIKKNLKDWKYSVEQNGTLIDTFDKNPKYDEVINSFKIAKRLECFNCLKR